MLSDSFGWIHPESHLMSWALSSLTLREHYDNLTLYTDSEGYHVLVEQLDLPYTDVRVIYDTLPCSAHHWAYAKVKTYSLQTEPFLHIDADVYIPQPISANLLQKPLIAQNREYGTSYYKSLMDRLLAHQGIWIPSSLEEGLQKASVSSYNMGVFGGSDLDFIHRYCDEVFRFFKENRLTDPSSPYFNTNCNVIFEQVFFATMADNEKREVASLLGRTMRDEGYSRKEFCNLRYFEETPFFHILGGHKRSNWISEMISKTLLRKYPDYYWRILEMFPSIHLRLTKNDTCSDLNAQTYLAQYTDFLLKSEKIWAKQDLGTLKKLESQKSLFCNFLNAEDKDHFTIRQHPFLQVFDIPSTWPQPIVELLRTRLSSEWSKTRFDIAIIPDLGKTGTREVAIDDIAHNILFFLEHPVPYHSLRKKIWSSFGDHVQKNAKLVEESIDNEIAYLLFNGIILAETRP